MKTIKAIQESEFAYEVSNLFEFTTDEVYGCENNCMTCPKRLEGCSFGQAHAERFGV